MLGHWLSEVVHIVVFGLNVSHDHVTFQDMVSDEMILCVNVFEPRVECLVLRNLDASVIGLDAQKQEEPKSYEEEHRNRRIGQNEGLQQSSLGSVVERLYDRSQPNRHERDCTTKPTGICSIMII